MKFVSFPRTYTTPGAVYRAKKNFTERFPELVFAVTKEDGKYVLNIDHAETAMKGIHSKSESVSTEPKSEEIV